jgi:hypothetical protein
MGRELAHLANEPKRLVTFPGGGHSDLYLNGNGAVEAMRDWIAEFKRATSRLAANRLSWPAEATEEEGQISE